MRSPRCLLFIALLSAAPALLAVDKGYKKDDQHSIIGIDTYELTEDKKGNIGGPTNANGSWKGRINGRSVEFNFL